MPTHQYMTWCPNCRAMRMTTGRTVNHVLHVLLSLLTGGCWLPVWLFVVLTHAPLWQCTTCGHRAPPGRSPRK